MAFKSNYRGGNNYTATHPPPTHTQPNSINTGLFFNVFGGISRNCSKISCDNSAANPNCDPIRTEKLTGCSPTAC